MFIIHPIEIYHIISRKKGRWVMKARGKKTKMWPYSIFLIAFFVCLKYSSKKPPTLHHVGRNQSQTGTYLWTLLLPESNSSSSEKKPIESALIHHSKAIGFETEAARLWFGETLCCDWFFAHSFNFFLPQNKALPLCNATFSLAEVSYSTF